MKRQKNMEKIFLALSFALKTCLLLLQCYSILALKIMWVRSQLSYIMPEAVLSRNNAIAQLKRMKSWYSSKNQKSLQTIICSKSTIKTVEQSAQS